MPAGANGSWGEGLTVRRGRIWVTLTVHAKRAFVDTATFRDLRGTDRFQEFVESLEDRLAGSSLFQRDRKSEQLRKVGYRAGVFHQHALEQELAPVYRFVGEGQPFLGSSGEEVEPGFRWRHDLSSFPFPPLGLLEEEDRLGLGRILSEEQIAQGVADLFAPLADSLRRVWVQWRKWILLTRYGYFQIWLRRSCNEESFTDVLQAAMKLNTRVDFASAIDDFVASRAGKSADTERLVSYLQRSGRSGARPFVTIFQWEIARLLIHQFLGQLEQGSAPPIASPLQFRRGLDEAWNKEADPEEGLDLPLRYRHAVFHFTELARRGETEPLAPEDLGEEDQLALASLLEGVPIRSSAAPDSEARIPPLLRGQLAQLVRRSTASWDGELLLISGDSSLLVTLRSDRLLVFDDDVRYLDYWMAVLRGVAHFCEMRVLALQLQAETKGLLDRSLTGLDTTPRLSHQSRTASTLLARLRTAADPGAIGGADYAVDKLRQASEAFDLAGAMQATQHNLELVNAAIDQEESMSLERSQASLNLGVAGFAVVTVLLALVPFWASASLPRNELKEAFPFYLRHAQLVDLAVGGCALALVALTTFVLLPLFIIRVFGDSLSFVLLRRRRRKLHGRHRRRGSRT